MSWFEQRPDDAMAGAFEAIGPDPVVAVDPKLFREAMSRYGSAVHVVTTDGPGGKTGFTATAICSVSDDPPTLLVCLNRKSQGSPLLAANRVFCVNTLAADTMCIYLNDAPPGAFDPDAHIRTAGKRHPGLQR